MAKRLMLIAFVLGLMPFQVEAVALNGEQATMIYMLAHSTTHYKLPDVAPEIHLTTKDKLREMVCPGKTCDVKALQVREKIYLDETLDMSDIQNAAILYHEAVHFLQWANRGEAKDCAEWLQRELEAYAMQNHVLEKAGARRIQMPALACS